MAAQVLSGSGNVSYTNSTGQNVRLVINYLKNNTATGTMSFQSVSVDLAVGGTYGKTFEEQAVIPLEIALSNGETFSITNSASSTYIDGYNIIIIPEAG